jgi:D-alanyl-D-alanine carboxypeptidase/D-alanyl-D-alanine-endopeptidase (penicillin-binding protein 4)
MGRRRFDRLNLPIAIAALFLSQAPARAQTADAPLAARVAAILAQAPAGTRYGLVVTDMAGQELLAIAPDQRFIPGSNTKIYTTATAWSRMAALDAAPSGAGVRLEPVKKKGRADLILVGRGDARLSSADDCKTDCLATLADAVAAKAKRLHDVIGDDTLFPDQRWSPGMSWNNIPTESGTGISALTLDDNELPLMVTPGAIGAAPRIEGLPYYAIENRAVTVAGNEARIDYWRDPATSLVRVTGTIGAEAPPHKLRLGIDDPAHYAAWRLRAMLEARGVKVKGAVGSRHRPLLPGDDPKERGGAPVQKPAQVPLLAELPSLPLAEDVMITNKPSQNLHAELLLRRLGALEGSGSIADGQAEVDRLAAQAGVPRAGYELADGSGMSSYNRTSPRATATLLRWIAAQPWGAAWRETLPIGGEDGTLRRRFKGTSLEGRIFAKTGSLNASRALSGYMLTKSGRTLIVSAIANDIANDEGGLATGPMDAALVAIAEAY